jgi:hypothetical protein
MGDDKTLFSLLDHLGLGSWTGRSIFSGWDLWMAFSCPVRPGIPAWAGWLVWLGVWGIGRYLYLEKPLGIKRASIS